MERSAGSDAPVSVEERIRRNREAAIAKLKRKRAEAARSTVVDLTASPAKSRRREAVESPAAAPAAPSLEGRGEEAVPLQWNAEDLCTECGKYPAEDWLERSFQLRVCSGCMAKTDDYELINKGTALADYLIPEPTLSLLTCAAKANPRHSAFSRMKLYLRKQVKEKALERWGSMAEVEKERKRREEQRVQRAIVKARRAIRGR